QAVFDRVQQYQEARDAAEALEDAAARTEALREAEKLAVTQGEFRLTLEEVSVRIAAEVLDLPDGVGEDGLVPAIAVVVRDHFFALMWPTSEPQGRSSTAGAPATP